MKWRGIARKLIGWPVVFTGLFVLAMDFWTWRRAVRLSFLNLPAWIYYFASLQLALAVAIWWFGRGRWAKSPDSAEPSPDIP